MSESINFMLYIDDQDMDDKRYQQYLRTDMSMSFEDFKSAQGYTGSRNTKVNKPSTVDDEQASLDFANQFIKPKSPRKENEVLDERTL